MTRDEIMKMESGRELNALVARKLFGVLNPDSRWRPSEDISAAWEVVEEMHEWGGCEIACCGTGDKRWYVVHTYTDSDMYQKGITVTCKTAPEAICKAALLAVMEG